MKLIQKASIVITILLVPITAYAIIVQLDMRRIRASHIRYEGIMLKQVYVALLAYRNQNNGAFPSSIEQLTKIGGDFAKTIEHYHKTTKKTFVDDVKYFPNATNQSDLVLLGPHVEVHLDGHIEKH